MGGLYYSKWLRVLARAPFEPLHSVPQTSHFFVAITSARRILELDAPSVREGLSTFLPNHVVLRPESMFILK